METFNGKIVLRDINKIDIVNREGLGVDLESENFKLRATLTIEKDFITLSFVDLNRKESLRKGFVLNYSLSENIKNQLKDYMNEELNEMVNETIRQLNKLTK
jgi:hypothetical protein